MAEPVIAATEPSHSAPGPQPQGAPDAQDSAALAGLARAGVATHAVSFNGHDGASLTDEARALEALAAVVEGQIFRLAPLRYAVRLAGDSAAGDALAAALALALDCPAPQVTALGAEPAPADDAPADMLRAFAAPAAQPLLRVMDAGAALAAAERTAAHIAGLTAQPDPSLTERLDRIEASLAALAARPQPEPAAPTAATVGEDAGLAALMARLEAQVDRLAALAERRPEADMGDRLAAIEASFERLPAAVLEALAARDGEDGLRAALDWLLQAVAELRAQRVAEAGELSTLLQQVRALAERPVVNVDFIREREGLMRLSSALQTMLSRLDAEASRFIAAARDSVAAPSGGASSDEAPSDGALDTRLAGLQAALERLAAPDAAAETLAAIQADIHALTAREPADPTETLAALRDEVRLLAERPIANVDFIREREGLFRLSSALQTMLGRLDAEASRFIAATRERADDGVAGDSGIAARLAGVEAALAGLAAPTDGGAADALAALRDEVRLLAERPAVNVDFLREREGMTRLSVALQTMLSRMDAEISRLVAAGQDATQASALADRLAAVETALDRLAAAPAPNAADAADFDALREDVRALATRPAPAGDLRAEREGLNRTLFGLQTLMARMEAELARLGGGEDQLAPLAERLDALTGALAPLSQAADALEQTREAALRGAQSAEAMIGVAQAVREECVELHGLHARWFEAGGAQRSGVDEPLVERIGATLAEFLAQLQRIEAQRAAQHALPPLRIGRGQ